MNGPYILFYGLFFPMFFFTLAGNILPAYVLPGLPAFSLLAAGVMTETKLSTADGSLKWIGIVKSGGFAMLVLFSIAAIIVSAGIGPSENSQKKLMGTFYKEIKGEKIHITYLFKRPFSAAFYSKGTAGKIDTTVKIDALLKNGDTDYMAVQENRLDRIPAPILNRFSDLGHINNYILLKEK